MAIGWHGLVGTGTFDEVGLTAAAERTRRADFDLPEIALLDPMPSMSQPLGACWRAGRSR
jgi:hypothetical protein